MLLALPGAPNAVFYRSDCDPGRGGGARGVSRRRRGPPGTARRLPEDAILIRTLKYVVSEAQVRQNIVNLHISQGVPKGAPEGPTRELPWENQHSAFRASDEVVVLGVEFA